MGTVVITPDELDRIVRSGIAGFDVPAGRAGDKPRVQRTMERTIRLIHEEGELELAAAVLLVHCCRAEGSPVLHEALRQLMEYRAQRSAIGPWKGGR